MFSGQLSSYVSPDDSSLCVAILTIKKIWHKRDIKTGERWCWSVNA